MIRVEEDEVGRIDIYLASKLDVSRSKIQKLLKNDLVFVNGKSVSSNYQIKSMDEIEVNDSFEEEMDIRPENIELDIVYEDEYLLVINKASGMVVHPAPGHYTNTLVNALLYRFNLSSKDNIRPGIVHRLDKDTSGLMLVAKNDIIHERLAEMIKNKEVEKHYLAIVLGRFDHLSGTIDAPIGRDFNDRQKMAVTDKNSKDAITHFKVLEQFENNALLECILETGRTHQIRVHLAYINHPIVNDPVYGKKKADDFGQMLHSTSIRFIHPVTKKELFFKVDPPLQFQEMLDSLRME